MINKNQSGQILLLVFVTLGVVLFTVLFVIGGSQLYFGNATYSVNSEKATTLAEAGIDKALASLNKTGGSYNGETETSFGDGSYSVTVTNKDAANKILQVTGYIPNKTSPKSKKTISVQVSTGAGIAFNYAVQTGAGGFIIAGGSTVNGTVYSNNDILLSGGSRITGNAYVAGGTQATPDQQVDCFGANCTDFIFGKVVSGNSQLDVAQSFKPSISAVINKVQLKLKKTGNPANLTVRILGDSSGSPNKNNVLASGILGANLVTTTYGFIDVTFTTPPALTANTVYWIMIDASNNSGNYWFWSEDLAQSYTRGTAKWSPDWSVRNPTWNSISGDLGFMTYMGGVTTKIAGTGSSYIDGSAYANTLIGDNSSAMQIAQDAYYQAQQGIFVHGANCTNNTQCHHGSSYPAPRALPLSDANIAEWKDMAENFVYTGNLVIQWPCTTNLEKKKYKRKNDQCSTF